MFCNSVNITPESLILTDFPCRMEILGFEENHSLLVIFQLDLIYFLEVNLYNLHPSQNLHDEFKRFMNNFPTF